jgi:Fe-S-cluster containining protein
MKLPVVSSDASGRPWYAEGLSFTCTQCGNCCTGPPGYVWISDEELERLAEFLKLPVDDVVRRYGRKIGRRISLKEHRTPAGEYDCVFLEHVKVEPTKPGEVAYTRRVCSVYPVRPLQCRTWPFWDGNLQSKEDWRRAARRCPGIDAGSRHFTFDRIEEIRTATDWPKAPPTSRGDS